MELISRIRTRLRGGIYRPRCLDCRRLKIIAFPETVCELCVSAVAALAISAAPKAFNRRARKDDAKLAEKCRFPCGVLFSVACACSAPFALESSCRRPATTRTFFYILLTI